MNLNKKLCTGILLSSTFIFAGCGGSDDSNPTFNDQNNNDPIVNGELKYSSYDIFSEVVNDKYKAAWGKLKFTLSNNGVKEQISTLVGSSATAYQDSRGDDDLYYYAGNNFFMSVDDNFYNRYYKINFINEDSFNLRISKDNATINYTYDILSYDISGVGKVDSSAKTGLYTELHYDYFPSNLTFPAGSTCYILQETSDQTYYDFSNDPDINTTLDEWLEYEKKWGNQITNLVRENVGQNNTLKAIRYTDQEGDINAAVLFNNAVYEASYIEKGVKQTRDTDPKTSLVACDSYNDTAAQFLDEQIKLNY